MSAAVALAPRFVERVWGSQNLAPLFGEFHCRIGEVWYDADPLLIKFLFTSEPLSVQVHPDDEFARRVEQAARGKTEMWYVLRAQPGARIAAGFREHLTVEQARQAAEDGSIEQLLQWWEAAEGDTFFTPPGTVHALGAGLVVCEIQQKCDITYRLFDYGRGRPLDLDKALAVAKLKPYPGKRQPTPLDDDAEELVSCPYFRVERRRLRAAWTCPEPALLMVVEGNCSLGTAGSVWRTTAPVLVQTDHAAVLLQVVTAGH